MNEENKKNTIIFTIIGIILLVVLAVCFYIAYKNRSTDTSSVTKSGDDASTISENYDDINYGTTSNLESTTITSGGSYNITGTYSCIIVNTTKDVQLNLSNATINCENGPAIYIKDADTVNIVLEGENTITSTTSADLDGAIYSTADLVFSGDGKLNITSNYDGIVSKDTLVFNNGTYVINSSDDGIRGKDDVAIVNGIFTITAGGDGIKSTNEEDATKGYIAIDNGTFTINSVSDGIQAETSLNIKNGTFDIKTTGNTNSVSAKGIKAGTTMTLAGGEFTINTTDDGIHTNGDMAISSGTYNITSKDDAIHADGMIEINGGTFTITAAEGIEATYVKINDGTINISASDDGINAGNKSNKYSVKIEINGGNITINMGQGDTDGVDSNGDIVINGGTISVTGQSTFDYDGTGVINGGTVICNGQQVTSLPNQMMGGGMQGGMPGQDGQGRSRGMR